MTEENKKCLRLRKCEKNCWESLSSKTKLRNVNYLLLMSFDEAGKMYASILDGLQTTSADVDLSATAP